MAARVFGAVPGVNVGQVFPSRRAASAVRVHAPTIGGISGAESEGADSIVVSGGYEDDEDRDTTIIYTGHGGNNPATGKQVANQALARGNLALATSCNRGLPVRVIRGAGGDPKYSPASGYRYDGLYYVDSYWSETGKSGYRIWRYELVRESATAVTIPGDGPEHGPTRRIATQVQRIVRTTEVAQAVKELHDHRCQVCGEVIETAAGPYAEAAHVRPLGRPHDGPDDRSNIVCLCPNDRVRFDRGSIYVDSHLRVVRTNTGLVLGKLRTVPGHHIDPEHLRYHRDRFAKS